MDFYNVLSLGCASIDNEFLTFGDNFEVQLFVCTPITAIFFVLGAELEVFGF